jgi:hypothetical protein
MIKYIFVILLLFLSFDVDAQNYKFSYQVKMYITQDNNATIKGDTMIMSIISEFMNVRMKYHCEGNERYLKTVTEEELQLFKLDNDPSNENEISIDFQNNLVLFNKSKKIYKNVIYNLIQVNDSLFTIKELGQNYKVILDKSLPKTIRPPIYFYNISCGIKSIQTPHFSMNIIPKSIELKKEIIDFGNIFRVYMRKKNNNLPIFDFFGND